MGSLTIRDIDQDLEQRLHLRAGQRNRSGEEEARDIQRFALDVNTEQQEHWVYRLRLRAEALGGVELELPPREPIREPPDFA